MNMQFYAVSKLLKSTTAILCSGYLIFSLIMLDLIFKQYAWNVQIAFLLTNIVLCATHHYVSFRVNFDANLLHMLFKQSKQHTTEVLTLELDQSLLSLNLIPQEKTERPWNLRFNGCLRLFKFQIMILFLQFLVLIMIFII